MRFVLNLLSLLLLVCPVSVWGHLGLTVPVGAGGIIRDTVIGDPYRYPNNGYCSGVSQPSPNKGRLQVGQTYNFRMNTGPAAPHGGGHCAFFVTTNGYNFYKLDDVAHCTCAPGQPGGTLNSGCAQNLGAGIQNQAIHSLTIPKNVPAACATGGCTLVWFWTPTFSAVCEIYSDCYDVIIDGATGGIESGVQLQGYPSRCSYPASNGLTTNYGAIIGKSGNGGTNTGGNNGGNTGGNNGGNTGGTNTGGTGTGTIRCGTSWTDANNKCGTACTNSDAQCPRGEFCFKDLKTCTGSTPAAPKPPSNGGNTGGSSGCRASGVFANTPGMNAWCASNCAVGNCPPSHCACTGAFTVSSSALEIEMYGAEIMEAYQPQCQAMIANGIASIRDMLTRMDSVAYFNYTQFSNETSEQVIHQAEQQSMEQVIKRLIKLNNMVLPENKKLYNETDVPTKGTIILMPGDCEMLGNDPSKLVPHTMVDLASGEKVYNNKSNTGSLSTPGLSLVILSFLLVCLSIVL